MYYYDYCNDIIIATAITIVIVIMIKTIIIFTIIIIIVIAVRAKNGLHKWGRSWVDIIIYM